ncbi:cytochrome-c peroxidase [Lysobacter sp. GX 14042]|uniref:cytochrome-c peroxidase n=1 Tax=Lysobacter sp. GX 14042 TaxID=2907155 RepID=UPI00272E4C5F|nr:cytochrome-c peroxidase [Lysobacter sp. GX 14042]
MSALLPAIPSRMHARLVRIGLAAAVCLALAACSGEPEGDAPSASTDPAPVPGASAPGLSTGPAASANEAVEPSADMAVTGVPEQALGAPADDLMARAQAVFKPIPARAPDPEGNPVTEEKVALGGQLFFDGRLSSSGVISCNSCHNIGMGGVDGVPTSIGHGFQKGPRNAPTVFNAVFNVAQFWDGRAADLMEQAKGPIEAAVEMNARPDEVLATLRSIPGYAEQFDLAFPGESEPLTYDNIARAIEAFEVTLVTPDAPFDQYLRGDNGALDAQARRGLAAFMDRGCIACHNGVNLGGTAYFPFGLVSRPGAELLPPGDKGRFEVTRTATDEYVFRAAPLRNVALTAPYFHTGQVWSLHEAVEVMGTAQLGTELTPEEVDDIVAFLGTLTGKQPRMEYPVLPVRGIDTPPPSAY